MLAIVANNPQLMQQQQQQQQYLRQRMMIQQQQAHAQQQQQQHGLPVSLPNGTQGLNAAQLAAMQANPGMARNPAMLMHLQQQVPHGQPQNLQQQQQLFAMQQAQHAQQQAQANNGQPGQHTPQRSSAQPPSMHETQTGTPQSQHGGPPQSGTPQPNPSSQPPSTQPPQSQGPPQAQATPQPQSQSLPPSQQPGQQPTPSGPQQPTQQGAQGQQGQVSGPPNQQAMAAQEAHLKAQQQQNQAALMMQQQQQRLNRHGQSILCLHSYAEHLGNFASQGEAVDLQYWQGFVDRFYAPGGVLRQGVWNPQVGSKQFEISTPALARYYLTQFTSGIKQIQMVVEAARERDMPNGGHMVESQKASFIYWFTNDCQLFTKAHLRAHFDINNKIEMLDIGVTSYNEYVPRSLVQSLEASEQKQSPKVTKNSGKRTQKQSQSASLPESMVTSNGVPTPVMSFLELAECISHMQLLFSYSQQNPNLSPPEALRNLVNTLQTHGPTPQFATPMNPGMQPVPNARGPNMNGPTQFASPALQHLGLPAGQGSPHLTGSAHASPAQSQIAGVPGMPVQPSPVGVNNSPNVGGNKRRRASTVKMEAEDGGGPEVNGTGGQGQTKVKASPRVTKRQKGAAS
ncbi:Transcriptional activator ptaB [Penicillium argentinense]|uniref:Transcriptional activator ptaB n=1 Tax=Penicillium argentinense TaxID=1131581 RepID=A0A9W9K1L3_9EURO|nr:Transcriptional activator ptaB [Penicillium argentinense]KAJ5089744.1 Transcriptional activator ptaB [Penicillium argentinense]